jgi:hypothetical protein
VSKGGHVDADVMTPPQEDSRGAVERYLFWCVSGGLLLYGYSVGSSNVVLSSQCNRRRLQPSNRRQVVSPRGSLLRRAAGGVSDW